MKQLAAVALTLSGCISVHFNRRLGFEPVPDAVLNELRTGGADLTVCLQRLGAPNLVYEQPDGGLALAWGWLDQFAWGIDASLSLRGVAVSGDFVGDKRVLEGAVLFFNRELQLVEVDRGRLRDFLAAMPRRRPADDE